MVGCRNGELNRRWHSVADPQRKTIGADAKPDAPVVSEAAITIVLGSTIQTIVLRVIAVAGRVVRAIRMPAVVLAMLEVVVEAVVVQ